LLDHERAKAAATESAMRRSMIGSGDRSEKVRTYNFPQDRLTDHRIGLDLHNLPTVMDGDIDKLIDALSNTYQAERLRLLSEAPEA
ncbi:MAG TPA: peptide chain release factor 1, partial [Candidatus Limnocylindrales bacterium]